jgi:exosome complex component RRP46
MIRITFQVLADDGSLISTAINAMILALVDAGIPMKSTASAVTCMINKSGVILLDPTALEIQVLSLLNEDSQSVHSFAFDSINQECYTFYSTGVYSEEEVNSH